MMKLTLKIERSYWQKGIDYVIGIDEVGRGAFAGPLVAAGVVFPKIKRITKKLNFLREIDDSKKLNAKKRRRLSKKILKHALFYQIEKIDIATINNIGIGKSNHLIIKNVADNLSLKIKNSRLHIICDGLPVHGLENHTSIIDGDCKSITIAAASIIAKVHRDSLMRDLSRKYRNYKFARNKGYGTKGHQKALFKYGLSEVHRTSFELSKFLTQ